MSFSAVQPIRVIAAFPERAQPGWLVGWDSHGVSEPVYAAVKFDGNRRVEWINASEMPIAFPDL